MGLQKEIWLHAIVEGLFADNTFAARSLNHSGFVNNRTVHVPNAGAAPTVAKGRSTFPATVTERTDVDLHYDIDEYTTDPIRIGHADQVELSYSKRESVIRTSRNALAEEVHDGLIYSWVPSSPKAIATLGASYAAAGELNATTTGNRKKMDAATVLAVKKQFDRDNIPQTGRYMLLDAVMYNQLLESLTDAAVANFLAGADAEKGIVGQYMGFGFYMRSKVAQTAANGTIKAWSASAAATDCAAGIAWHEDAVSIALGDVQMFENDADPTYYGDIVSFLVRCGGKNVRNDKKGIALVYQGTPA